MDEPKRGELLESLGQLSGRCGWILHSTAANIRYIVEVQSSSRTKEVILKNDSRLEKMDRFIDS